jgi:hypothetical protein
VESKTFLRIMIPVTFAWIGLGLFLFGWGTPLFSIFFEVFWAVILDLVFLILLFWELFFARGPSRRVQVVIYFTFKLVCLGFLAITLKRLRNDPPLPAAIAVLFMGVGPLVSAILARRGINTK